MPLPQELIDAYEATDDRGRETILSCAVRQVKSHPLRKQMHLHLVAAGLSGNGPGGLVARSAHNLVTSPAVSPAVQIK